MTDNAIKAYLMTVRVIKDLNASALMVLTFKALHEGLLEEISLSP